MNLEEREKELKKRHSYPYKWGRLQNDYYDNLTNFIYSTIRFKDLLAVIEKRFCGKEEYESYLHYAINRWYNFWSANSIEKIFHSLSGVEAASDERDRLVDFSIDGIQFDHKSSIFPKGFGKNLSYAQKHPGELIDWLYKHQSQQKRKHLENRLFIIFYSRESSHWKLKAELHWIKSLIEDYVWNFDRRNLYHFKSTNGVIIQSDIIWAIK